MRGARTIPTPSPLRAVGPGPNPGSSGAFTGHVSSRVPGPLAESPNGGRHRATVERPGGAGLLAAGAVRCQTGGRDTGRGISTHTRAIRTASPSQIEAIDMGRRGLHNEASETLKQRLDGKVDLDHDTARRLFTLIFALHWKG